MARWTQFQYERLREAASQGVMQVQYEDRLVKFQSRNEMMATLREMESDLGLRGGSRRILPSTNKGLGAPSSDAFDWLR